MEPVKSKRLKIAQERSKRVEMARKGVEMPRERVEIDRDCMVFLCGWIAILIWTIINH